MSPGDEGNAGACGGVVVSEDYLCSILNCGADNALLSSVDMSGFILVDSSAWQVTCTDC